MAEQSARAVLNHLIETCKDGEQGFRTAATLVADSSVKAVFMDMAAQRARFAEELLPHARRLGGPAASDGTSAGSMHRRWMDVRDRLSGHDDRVILTEVLRGDSVTARVYGDALAGILPLTVRDLVEQQYVKVREEHERLDAVRQAW